MTAPELIQKIIQQAKRVSYDGTVAHVSTTNLSVRRNGAYFEVLSKNGRDLWDVQLQYAPTAWNTEIFEQLDRSFSHVVELGRNARVVADLEKLLD